MPAAKGLFHRAAIQSGANLRATAREAADKTARAFMAEMGISPNSVDEMQNVPANRLLSAMTDMSKRQAAGPAGGLSGFAFGPVMDGKILPTHPFDPVASPMSATIPILVGCTTHEQSLMVLGRDEAAFNLDEAGLRTRVETMVGKSNVARVIDTYKKAHPGKSPSELYFLLSSDRGMRMGAIRLAERKFAQGQSSRIYVLVCLAIACAWRNVGRDAYSTRSRSYLITPISRR